MKILFVGDVYAKPGRRAAAFFIPQLIEAHVVDFCIVNGENSAGGFGITEKTIGSLAKADGLVVGSALCKSITNALARNTDPIRSVENMVKQLKAKII